MTPDQGNVLNWQRKNFFLLVQKSTNRSGSECVCISLRNLLYSVIILFIEIINLITKFEKLINKKARKLRFRHLEAIWSRILCQLLTPLIANPLRKWKRRTLIEPFAR